MSARAWLTVYRIAWILALPPVRLLAAVDRALLGLLGRGFLPSNWHVTERLGYRASPADGVEPLWMHCASLGEAKGLWGLASGLPPDFPILFTAATREGAEFLAGQCDGGGPGRTRAAAIAPFDHPRLVRRFLSRERVRGLVLYEAEIWPHYISECRRSGLPVALAAGRITPRIYPWYRRMGGAGARLLDGIDWIQAQSPIDAERFAALTSAELLPGFDFKAAHYLTPRSPSAAEPREGFAFISLRLAELRILLPGLPALTARDRVIIFPRRLSESAGFLAALQPLGFAPHSREPDARLMLVDSLGHVARLLNGCHSAFVGGSLDGGGCHNLWEPLAAGAAVHFGPHHHVQETMADALLRAGLGKVVSGPADLETHERPDPGVPRANALFLAGLRAELEAGLQECRERIFATFPGRQTPAPALLRDGVGGGLTA